MIFALGNSLSFGDALHGGRGIRWNVNWVQGASLHWVQDANIPIDKLVRIVGQCLRPLLEQVPEGGGVGPACKPSQ